MCCDSTQTFVERNVASAYKIILQIFYNKVENQGRKVQSFIDPGKMITNQCSTHAETTKRTFRQYPRYEFVLHPVHYATNGSSVKSMMSTNYDFCFLRNGKPNSAHKHTHGTKRGNTNGKHPRCTIIPKSSKCSLYSLT